MITRISCRPATSARTKTGLSERAGCVAPTRARRGVTFLEILVAMFVVIVGLAGVLGTATAVETQMGGGVRETVAAALAQARLDSLASLSCAQLPGGLSGYSTTRGVSENWRVVDGRNTKTLSVTIALPRRTARPVYSTVIPCRD